MLAWLVVVAVACAASGLDELPAGIPQDWIAPYLNGDLLYSDAPANLMPEVGNGFIASVVQSDTIYASGVFNGIGDVTPSHRARIAPFVVSVTQAPDTPVFLALNMLEAVFYQRSTVLSKNNVPIFLEERWYASYTNPSLLVHEFHFNSSSTEEETITFSCAYSSPSSDTNVVSVSSSFENVVAVNGTTLLLELPTDAPTVIAMASTNVTSVTIPSGGTAFVLTLNVVVSSLNSSNPLEDAITFHQQGMATGSSLFSQHIEAWNERTMNGNIQIDNILPLAQAVNSSLYYIRSSVRSDWPFGMSPGGLASNGYNGHSFWDVETWMYPTLLMLEPESAKSLIDYRYNRIQQAQLKAQFFNYSGQMYPWESAFTGFDVCPGGPYGPNQEGLYEIHISADIAFAIRQYWIVTNDIEWLSNIAFPIISGIADFWVSRAVLSSSSSSSSSLSSYSINNVQPPDEYHYPVNNSVYTNVAASIALNFAVEIANILNVSYPSNWQTVAENLIVLFDNQTQFHPEYDGYTNEIVKQADVILLGFPLMYEMSKNIRENDLSFYGNYTDNNGPAMTWAMFAIGWIDVEDYETAANYFTRGYANIQAPFNVWQETPTGGTVNFITGAGGFLQSVVFGYGGLRINGSGLIVNPPPTPQNTTTLTLKSIHYLNNSLNIAITNTSITIQVIAQAVGFVDLVYQAQSGEPTLLILNESIIVARAPGAIYAA